MFLPHFSSLLTSSHNVLRVTSSCSSVSAGQSGNVWNQLPENCRSELNQIITDFLLLFTLYVTDLDFSHCFTLLLHFVTMPYNVINFYELSVAAACSRVWISCSTGPGQLSHNNHTKLSHSRRHKQVVLSHHVNTEAFDLSGKMKHQLIRKVMSFYDLFPIIDISIYLSLTSAMFTFLIVAIPDVLYLLLRNPTRPVMENVFFGSVGDK